MSPRSSCQPHHHEVVGKCERSGTVNSHLKTLSGAMHCVFRVKWPSAVAAGGSLFSRVRASIRESGRQNVHDTVARARLHKTKKTGKKLTASGHFWNLTSTKCVRDSSASSISQNYRKKLTASDHFWKMTSAKCARDCSESSVPQKNMKKLTVSDYFDDEVD